MRSSAGLARPAAPCSPLQMSTSTPDSIDSDQPFPPSPEQAGRNCPPEERQGRCGSRQVRGCSQGLTYEFWDGAAVHGRGLIPLCCLRCESTSSGGLIFFFFLLYGQSFFKLRLSSCLGWAAAPWRSPGINSCRGGAAVTGAMQERR